MVRYGHKTGLTAMHQCCADGTWYVMLSEDEMRNSLGMQAGFIPLLFCFIHSLFAVFVEVVAFVIRCRCCFALLSICRSIFLSVAHSRCGLFRNRLVYGYVFSNYGRMIIQVSCDQNRAYWLEKLPGIRASILVLCCRKYEHLATVLRNVCSILRHHLL